MLAGETLAGFPGGAAGGLPVGLAEADMLADGAGAEVSSAKLKLPVAIPNATNKQINFIVFIS